MKTCKLLEPPRAEPQEPLLAEVVALQEAQPGSGLPCPADYDFYSIVGPLYLRGSPFWFMKTASALRSWVGGHCPARMAATLVAIHPFEGQALNATNLLGILLLVAEGLLGLSLPGALGRSMRFLSTVCKQLTHRPPGHH